MSSFIEISFFTTYCSRNNTGRILTPRKLIGIMANRECNLYERTPHFAKAEDFNPRHYWNVLFIHITIMLLLTLLTKNLMGVMMGGIFNVRLWCSSPGFTVMRLHCNSQTLSVDIVWLRFCASELMWGTEAPNSSVSFFLSCPAVISIAPKVTKDYNCSTTMIPFKVISQVITGYFIAERVNYSQF